MLKKKGLCVLLALCMFSSLFGACGNTPVPTPTPSTSATITASPTPAATSTVAPSMAPTPAPDPFVDTSFVKPDPNMRPVSVMIDNEGTRPLPQGGIRQAQVVYEVLTEFHITRFMAIFWGNIPEMVGPVRSSRHYFLDYAMEYDCIYTHYGWSPMAQKDISRLKINNINGLVDGNAFWDTDKNKGNWQDSFTSGTRIAAAIKSRKYSTTPRQPFPFVYNEVFTVPATGDAALDLSIKFANGSYSEYKYDAKTGLYARFRQGAAQMERNTNLQVTPRNVIVQVVPSSTIKGDEKGRISVDTVGKGKGWLMTGGKVVPLTWSKKARDAQTEYLLDGKNPMLLNPGQTWIEITPSATKVVIQ